MARSIAALLRKLPFHRSSSAQDRIADPRDPAAGSPIREDAPSVGSASAGNGVRTDKANTDFELRHASPEFTLTRAGAGAKTMGKHPPWVSPPARGFVVEWPRPIQRRPIGTRRGRCRRLNPPFLPRRIRGRTR
jgi:hypothetical protein